MPEASQKVLVQQLRELEVQGIVARKVCAQVPPRVEYSTTKLGRSLKPVVGALCKWGTRHQAVLDGIDAAPPAARPGLPPLVEDFPPASDGEAAGCGGRAGNGDVAPNQSALALDARARHAPAMDGSPEHVVSVRMETPADVGGIYAVHAESFPTTAEAALVGALRAAGHLTLSLVAIEDDQVVGHVAFSPVTVDGAPLGLGLGPVAVRPGSRQRGVAARLIREGLDRCRREAAGLVVVLGDPRYYGRFGFVPARRLALSDEYGGGDAFQALELVRGTVPAAGGLVRYSPVFAALGV